jgi:lipopolysaccharide/colanic/teichoic acid biosynthesis glycosyltransferase
MMAVGSGMAGVAGYLARRYFEMAKEVFDILLGGLAFIASLPMFLICAAVIKLTSRGPVLFTQVRAGKGGRPFVMYKFRTMYRDAEKLSGATWAAENDPRIIPACRWMRRSHMDELPQLLNVLKGEMSLIGPRPERPEILEELRKHYPNVDQRLEVKPGITGLAQIRNGYDSSVEQFRYKLAADLEYISKQSWRQEMRILLGTFAKLNDHQAR